MANVKITELTAATALAGTDVLPIVDVGADATKKVSVSDLLRNLPDGTASAPALAFADDQNTGVLSPGDNSLAFATSGTQRLVIDSSGQVGIGTTSPQHILHLHKADSGTNYLQITNSTTGSTSTDGALFGLNSDEDVIVWQREANNIQFGTNNAERVRIDSSGNLGIGTTSPENNLHIADTSGPIIRLTNSTGTDGTYTGRISTGDAAGTFFAGINFFKHDTNDGEIRFRTKVDGTNQDTVTIVDGRVGIGTTSPTELLHTVKSSGTSRVRFEASAAHSFARLVAGSTSYNSGVEFFSGTTNTANITAEGDGELVVEANGSERMRIDSSGNVGIGNTVAATIDGVNSAGTLVVGNGSSAEGVTIYTSDSTAGELAFADGTSGSATQRGRIIYSHGDNSMRFSTDASEAVRIDSSGRLGLGTSSPADYDLGADDLVVANSGNGGISVITGTSSVGALYFGDGTASNEPYRGRIEYKHSEDSLNFGSAGSLRATIDSSGRLLVGATSGAGKFIVQDSSLPKIQANYAGSKHMEFGVGGSGCGFVMTTGHFMTFNHQPYADRGTDNNLTERMRIASDGKVRINRTSNLFTEQFIVESDTTSVNPMTVSNTRSSASTDYSIIFGRNGSIVGSIQTSLSATSYVTSSDHRLKQNVVDISDGITRVKQLQPRRFNFIADADTTVDGFLAHEAQTVVPEAVTGTHNQVDDDNNPVYQGIDQSKLVPVLTAALQEAIAKIETLETKVAALEAQ